MTFADAGNDKTELVYHQTGHMAPEEYRRVKEGIESYFDSLAGYLSQAWAGAGSPR